MVGRFGRGLQVFGKLEFVDSGVCLWNLDECLCHNVIQPSYDSAQVVADCLIYCESTVVKIDVGL